VVNQKVVLGLLAKLGYRADAVGNGLEAVQAMELVPYDLVIMDCQMPELDGFEATRRIRRLAGSRANVPIVALTANAMQGDRERCLEVGMNDYVTKPVDVGRLSAVMSRWVQAAQTTAPVLDKAV
jgi:CheY-like chemotaxis protein